MALLAQTAQKIALLYQPGTAVYGVLPDFLARLSPVQTGVYAPATVAWGATALGTVTSLRSEPPLLNTDAVIWPQQTSWPILLNQLVGWGQFSLPPAGSKRVSGVFQDQNSSPIARVGFLYDRATGAYLTTFNSSAIDGSWDGYVPNTNPVFVVLIPAGADSRNAVVLDNLVPVTGGRCPDYSHLALAELSAAYTAPAGASLALQESACSYTPPIIV